MRNLKRALSLTLASVMLLGMMVVGTSALSFKDSDQITNVTAASVMEGIELFQGDGNGNFLPNATVTRAQMAAIVGKMLYGSKLDDTQFKGTNKFTDVPLNHYANGYINLVASLGLMNGTSATTFTPDRTLTTAEAALLLCRALGYFQGNELTGNWAEDRVTAMAQATKLGLLNGLNLPVDAPLNRDNVAAMTFNALTEVVPVMYNKNFDIYYTDSKSWAQGVQFQWKDTLGYKNFDLVCQTVASGDDFGRPATEWGTGTCTGTTVDNKPAGVVMKNSIIKAADEPVLTYTDGVKGKTIFADLGKPSTIKVTAATVNDGKYKLDGADTTLPITLDNNEDDKLGGKGTLIEVYKQDDDVVRIVAVNTYLIQATADYSTKDEELKVKPLSGGVTLANSNKISNDDVAVAGYKKDDLLLATGTVSGSVLTVKAVAPATVVNNVKVSAFKTGDYVTAGGTKYNYNATGVWDKDTVIDSYNLQKAEYNFILDKYGYVIGVEKSSDEVTLDEILFVKDAKDMGWSWEAKVKFMDGSEKTITIAGTTNATGTEYKAVGSDTNTTNGDGTTAALSKPGDMSKNRFYEFNEKSNGEYELKDIPNARQGQTTASGNTENNLKGGELKPLYSGATTPVLVNKTATDDTIFIAKDTVYTGAKNSPNVADAVVYYLLDDDAQNYILAAYVDKKGVVTVDASEYVYIFEYPHDSSKKSEGVDENDNKYYIYTALKDGVKNEDFHANDKDKATGLYKIESYENGYPVLGTAIAGDDPDVLDYTASVNKTAISYKGGVVNAGGSYRMASDGKVYVVNSDDKDINEIDASNVDSIDAGTYTVYAIQASKSNKDIVALWLVKAATPATRTVTAPDAKTDALGQKTTIAASDASAADGATVTYTVTLSETATQTNKYTITLAGLTSVSVNNDSSAPSNWKAVKVSDTQVDIYVTNAAAVSGAVKISGTVNNNVTATIGNGAQTYRFQNATQATGANLTATVVADKEWATASEKVTYTVAIATATASNDAENDTFTVAATGGATSLTVAKGADGNDVTLKNCSATGLVIKITANDAETSGSWTFSIDAPSQNVQPTITYAAGT